MFGYLTSTVPEGVRLMPDIAYYLSITSHFFILFGLAFEVPVVVLFLVGSEVLSLSQLEKGRAYFIVFSFIVGMILTPPDVLSQVMLALPLCLLYEMGILASKYWLRSKANKEVLLHRE